MRASHQSDSVLIPPPALASSRYNRQLLIPQISLSGQERIAASSMLIIGLGGLGSPASLYLASAGIGKLGFVDSDTVEESNLHRQIVHAESRMGMSKVQSALEGCKAINSTIIYEAFDERLDSTRVFEIMQGYDVVLDCTDNPATRYLISDACVVLGKTLVSGAAQKMEGQLMVLNYPTGESDGTRGPCYRCVFPRPPPPDMVKGCSEIGILGPVVGAIGTLMATEAIKIAIKGDDYGKDRKPSMLLYNAWIEDSRNMFRTVGLRGRRKDCVACGEEAVVRGKGTEKLTRESIQEGRMDYVAFCGVEEDVKLLSKQQRISAREFLQKSLKPGDAVVVDVREEHEIEIGAKIRDSINIPISRILRDGGEEVIVAVQKRAEKDSKLNQPVYYVCHRGNDSQTAAQKLIEHDKKSSDGIGRGRWVGDVEGGFVAMSKTQESQ